MAGSEPRRGPHDPPAGWPEYRWAVRGLDYNGNDYDETEATREAADASASRLNGKGGRVRVSRQRWHNCYPGYLDCPED